MEPPGAGVFNLDFLNKLSLPLQFLAFLLWLAYLFYKQATPERREAREARRKAEEAEQAARLGREKVELDRFEAASEWEAAWRIEMRAEMQGLKEENRLLRGQLEDAQRQLSEALRSLGRLEQQVGKVGGQVGKVQDSIDGNGH
jgi:DNA repair exonuclease SbcCD ATPase subunit